MRLLVRVAINAEQLLYRSPGGIGRYTAQLLTVLPSCFPDVEMVPVVARHRPEDIRAAFDRAGVPGGHPPERSPLPAPLLYQAWVRLGWPPLPPADLVHAPSVAVPGRSRAPLVVTVHDAAPSLFPADFPRWGRQFHHRALRAVARRADLVITVTRAAADEILDHSAVPAERVRVVPNGVAPLEIGDGERDRMLRARGLDGPPYVLWVGSLEPRKGVATLVAAMAEIRRRAPAGDTRLVLAGYEGWLNDDLIDPDDRRVLGPALHQLGPVSEAELWALYRGATVFAFPSRHEGFGLPVVEAMSQGAPVLASDIPAVREVAGGAARLVGPGDVKGWADALADLLSDEPARRRLAGAGLARSREFSVERMAAATRDVYLEVAR